MASTVPQNPIVGIDLGTTNSLVAWCDERGPRILVEPDGDALVPSAVRLPSAGEPIVGREARDHAVEYPAETVLSIKRLMGRSFEELEAESRGAAVPVVAGPRGMACVRVHGRDRTPQEISAMVLRALRARAERVLGVPVRRAVVTVPAYFDDAQRQATRDAGRLAGLDVVRIVNEPTAAALAYGIGRRTRDAETIAVFDLGGGTFDVSILRVVPGEVETGEVASLPGADGAASAAPDPDHGAASGAVEGQGAGDVATNAFFQVLATAGDTQLGGDDLDRSIVNWIRSALQQQFGAQLELTPSARQALRRFAESAKIALSERQSVPLSIDIGGGRRLDLVLDRASLEQMAQPLIDRALECCRRALRDAATSPDAIDRVVMVGGMTRMPLVREAVQSFFGRTPYTALDPDQVVALGAAVQAAVLGGTAKDLLLLDVIPLSLGIETVGGAVAKLIMRNSAVPARAVERFSTSVDGQVNVLIHVVQGERELVGDCRSLARFDLRGIPPMPAGVPQIEVEFMVDANGILDVTAVERRSGRRAAIQVVPSYGLTREEVDRMERESIEHARADMRAHHVIDLVVNATLDLKWIGEALDRVRDELEPAYVAELERNMAHVRSLIDSARRDPAAADADALAKAKQDLDVASVRAHEVAIANSLRGMGTAASSAKGDGRPAS